MHQLKFKELTDSNRVVNVASVPQRSPFRYPGGKTWLIPHIRRWFDKFSQKPDLLIEPFAGGGIVSLTVAFENLANHVLLVELDEQVASVWESLLNGETDWLAERIINFKISPESVAEELTKNDDSLRDVAFRTLLKNRISHGGIMAPGAGIIRTGENGKGIASRWYPQTLARRIRNIGLIADRIEFVRGDGLSVLRQNLERPDSVFFIDPPYTVGGKKAGTRLYTYNELNHEELFSLASSIRGDFLMTYDNTEDVRKMATRHGFDVTEVPMQNTHHTEMLELLIGKDLNWIRE